MDKYGYNDKYHHKYYHYDNKDIKYSRSCDRNYRKYQKTYENRRSRSHSYDRYIKRGELYD